MDHRPSSNPTSGATVESASKQAPIPASTMNGKPAEKAQPPPQSPNKGQPRRPSGAGKDSLSGAELKKKAKAEKQARRAQAKQTQPQPPAGVPTQPQKKVQDGADGAKKGNQQSSGAGAQSKGPQKRSAGPNRPTAAEGRDHAPSKKDNKKVALFGHLYGQPRRFTIAGASKDIHPAVLALGLQMSSYAICGSSARCVATLLAFKRVIESYITPAGNSLPRHLTSHLNTQIDYLVSCRPISTSMGNAIRWLKVEINDIDPSVDESEAKASLCESVDRFILERITAADQAITTTASTKIADGDVILTFAKSNIVLQTLIAAHRKGQKFRAIVIDSRPLFEGKDTARALAEAGIEVQYSLTHALSHCIRDASKVFLGAHSMLSNGRLYSRTGSALVAMMAKTADVPVIVCCESIKFSERSHLDSIVSNEVAPPEELVSSTGTGPSVLAKWKDIPNLQLLNLMYDVTPAEYISMVVTEYGSLPPSSVPVVHRLSTNT